MALSEVWAKGGEGGMALAEEVVRLCEQPNELHVLAIPTGTRHRRRRSRPSPRKVYHADGVGLHSRTPQKQLEQPARELGFGDLPVCMAKTQYSFSDDADQAGRARETSASRCATVKVSAGAGFVVALTGDIMTMPGLPKVPAAEKIDVDENGKITGLF